MYFNGKLIVDGLKKIYDMEEFIKRVDEHLDFLLELREYLEENEEYARKHEDAINNRIVGVIEGKLSEEKAEKEIKRIVEREKKQQLTLLEMKERVESKLKTINDVDFIKEKLEDGLLLIVRRRHWSDDIPYKIIYVKDDELISKQVKSVRTIYNILFNGKIELNRLEDIQELEEVEIIYIKAMLFDEDEKYRKLFEKFLVLFELK